MFFKKSLTALCSVLVFFLKQSMGARNRFGIGLTYRPARLHRLAGIDSLESIPGAFKSVKIRALDGIIL
jgi:hypothetical protein